MNSSASVHDDKPSDYRHPHLTGLRQDVYDFVNDNPKCTRQDVADGIRLKSSTTTARIKELIDEGFLFEPGDKKRNKSGVMSRCLMVTDRPKGGKPLDKVRVEVTLTIDHNGRYGADARVVGGGSTNSGSSFAIKRQQITLTAPHPDTYKSSRAAAGKTSTVSTVTRMETQANAGDIIDADYYLIED